MYNINNINNINNMNSETQEKYILILQIFNKKYKLY
jgi:hypothetical protein